MKRFATSIIATTLIFTLALVGTAMAQAPQPAAGDQIDDPAPQPTSGLEAEKYDPNKVSVLDPERASFRLFFGFGAYLTTDEDKRSERRDDKVIAGGQVNLTGWFAVSQHFGVLARAEVGFGGFAGSTGVPIRGGIGLGYRSLCDWYSGALFIEGESVRNATNRTALTGPALRAEFAFKPGESYDPGVPQVVIGAGVLFGFNELGNYMPAFEATIGFRWKIFASY